MKELENIEYDIKGWFLFVHYLNCLEWNKDSNS